MKGKSPTNQYLIAISTPISNTNQKDKPKPAATRKTLTGAPSTQVKSPSRPTAVETKKGQNTDLEAVKKNVKTIETEDIIPEQTKAREEKEAIFNQNKRTNPKSKLSLK